MAIAQSQLQDRLALVSSLYGPGTIACWYLTALSVLVSWLLHPRKRKSGSIDVDLIAVLTLPAVAAGHLFSQVRGFLSQDKIVPAGSNAHWKYRQSVAAIEASLNVTETFVAISAVLLIVACWTFCFRRVILVSSVSFLCLAVESYVRFSKFRAFGLQYKRPDVSGAMITTFSRLFLADFPTLVVAILVIFSVSGLISTAIAFCMYSPPRTAPSMSQLDVERVNDIALRERSPSSSDTSTVEVTRSSGMPFGIRLPRRSEDLSIRSSKAVYTLMLPVIFVLSVLPPIWHSKNSPRVVTATMPFWQTLKYYASRIARNFFPRSACSITDLDQAVAATAGATVLAFSVYSVAKARYKIWSVRRTPPSAPTSTGLSRFGDHPAP